MAISTTIIIIWILTVNKLSFREGYKKQGLLIQVVFGMGILALAITLGQKNAAAVFTTAYLSAMLHLSYIDIKHKEVPASVTAYLYLTGLVSVFFFGSWTSVFSAFGIFLFMLIVVVLSGGGLGGGDIKLYPACILNMVLSPTTAVAFVTFTMLSNVIYFIIGKLFKQNMSLSTELAHVPFMFIGSLFTVFSLIIGG